MPRSSQSAQTYKHAFENFPGGTFAPFYAIVSTKDRSDRDRVLDEKFFEAVQATASRLSSRSKLFDDRFTAQVGHGICCFVGVRYCRNYALF
jgi:hypothetical protein